MTTETSAAAHGRWREILRDLAGLQSEQLSDRHQPCPACGGTDRYRFDDKDGSGSWYCNQCGGKDHLGGGGSGIDLLMRVRHWSFRQASAELERYLALPPQTPGRHRPQPPAASGGARVRPWRQPEHPPPAAPPPPLQQGAIDQWCYRDQDGNQLFWIQRLRLRSGGKAFLHRVWLDGAWHRPSRRDAFSCHWAPPRPLYGLPSLLQRPEAPVLVVEGEGTADAAARLFPEHVVISWANGSNAITKADWQPLAGRSVTLWPDADAAGRQAMDQLAALLDPLDCQLHLVDPPAELPAGWDLADATWSTAEAAEHLQQWARPLPAAPLHAAPEPSHADDRLPAGGGGDDPFHCLGYDGEGYYYQPSSTGQVMRLTRSGHTQTNLLALVPSLPYWETLFPSRSGANWAAAAACLFQRQRVAGPYDPRRIRGRGGWFDNGRAVLHLGDRLIIDGTPQPVTIAVEGSRFLYQRLAPLLGHADAEPLGDQEAFSILALLERFHWEIPASGMLLAGWCTLAPICGALDWRPHIWITGGAGTGKSAVLNHVVKVLLGDMAHNLLGTTTEAGIRQILRSDALPVILDEAEGNEKRDQLRIQNVLALARVASSETGGSVVKGSPTGEVTTYMIRSSFCLASIATALKQGADQSRFSLLALRIPYELTSDARAAHWCALERDLLNTITPELAQRLLARTIALIPTIRANARTFSLEAARHFSSQRLGDQYGTLLAGAYSLQCRERVTSQAAIDLIAGVDWQPYGESCAATDEQRCLQTILQHQVRVETDRGTHTRTIGELVSIAAGDQSEWEVPAATAEAALGRHGLKVSDGGLLVSNTAQAIASILRDTAWSHAWAAVLQRIPGAQRTAVHYFRGAGSRARAVNIPLSAL